MARFLRQSVDMCLHQSRSSHMLSTPILMHHLKAVRPLVHCLTCCRAPTSGFHTASMLCDSKAKNTKKKMVRPIILSKKSVTKSEEIVTVWPGMTVKDLAEGMGKDVDHVFEVFLYVNDTDHYDEPNSAIENMKVIKTTLEKSGFRFKLQEKTKEVHKEDKDAYPSPPAEGSALVKRAPVVTIMGHVDHGKTTLLDALRHSNVVASEFGGITQHIGAFSVLLPTGERITFLDTPGHAAFSAMRSRGAHITDLVVLVVAADDGVMKQTAESIRYAQEAGVPIVVAINKIDKPGADIEASKTGLLQFGIQLEDSGGDVQAVPISALQGTNLELLQEAIVAQAELLELKADKTGLVEGVVVESHTDQGRGKLSTALIKRGTLKRGACLVAGTTWAKVRGMFGDQGRPIQSAGPGTPVEVIGWRDLPSAGDVILQVESEQRAHEVVRYRSDKMKEEKMDADQKMISLKASEHQEEYDRLRNERLAKGYRSGFIYNRLRQKEEVVMHTGPQLSIVIKGDVDGSVEAILDMLDTYDDERCRLDMLAYGVGMISEHDVNMAAAFNGIIYAFNVKAPEAVRRLAEAKKVTIRNHNIIYKLYDDLKVELNNRIPITTEMEIIGEANVLAQFQVADGKKKVPVAGCRCVKGTLQKKANFQLIREKGYDHEDEGEVLIDGPLSSLKHFKNEVESIKNDVECGLSFKDISMTPRPGDRIVCYREKEVKHNVHWELGF